MKTVARYSELLRTGSLELHVDGDVVALFLIDGKVIATTGICPHAGGPLSASSICGAKISCPWHGWTYDLHTGACDEDEDLRLPFYDVRVDGDDILLSR